MIITLNCHQSLQLYNNETISHNKVIYDSK